MPILLMGHGAETYEDVVVPDGLRISFLVDHGISPYFSSTVGFVLNAETLMKAGFHYTETVVSGGVTNNHVLERLDSFERSLYAQVDPEDGSCWYAGEHFEAPIRLCNDPAQCSGGVHTCGGLFSFTWPSDHLVWVSCRRLPHQASARAGTGIGSPPHTGFDAFAEDVHRRFQESSRDDFARYFDALPPDQLALVMSNTEIRRWAWVRSGHEYLRAHGDHQFYRMVESDRTFTEYLTDKDLREAHERGKAEAAACDRMVTLAKKLAKEDPQSFAHFIANLRGRRRDWVLADPEIAQHVRQSDRGRPPER